MAKVATRAAEILPTRNDGEEGEAPIRAIFTTERAVPMIDWERWEIVPQILRMAGLEEVRSVPLLDSHNKERSSDVLGRGIDLKTEGGNLEGTLDFDRNDPDALKIENKVRGGFLTDVSVGYEVKAQTFVKPNESIEIGGRTYEAGAAGLNVATDWRMREISTTPIGADSDAKVLEKAARSAGFESLEEARASLESKPNRTMAEPKAEPKGEPQSRSVEPTEPQKVPAGKSKAANRAADKAADEERKAEIRSIGKRCDIAEDKILLAELRGTSSADFQREVADEIEARAQANPLNLEAGLSRSEVESYSLNKVILARAMGTSLDGVEQEAHEALVDSYRAATGEEPEGILIPSEITRASGGMQTRNMEAGEDAEGGYLVPTELRSIIDYLKEGLYMNQLGATLLTDLSGNVEWPRGTNELTATWADEEGAATPSTLSFGNLAMSPKRVVAQTGFTLQVARQSSTDVDALNRREIGYAIAKAIDRAALVGAGGLAPTGILNEVGTQPHTFGGPPTWASVVAMTGLLEDTAGINHAAAKFASTGSTKAVWKTTEKAAGQGGFILESENGMYKADDKEFVNLVLSGADATAFADKVILGDWSQVMIGLWGGVDLVVDPYTAAGNGIINVTANGFADVGTRHPTAFVVSTDDGNQTV